MGINARQLDESQAEKFQTPFSRVPVAPPRTRRGQVVSSPLTPSNRDEVPHLLSSLFTACRAQPCSPLPSRSREKMRCADFRVFSLGARSARDNGARP